MYQIVGTDGKTYGPITADTLRQWIREGRANGHTQVRAEGGTEWKPAASFSEFAAELSPTAPGMPPRLASPAGPANATNRAGNKIVAGICGILLGTWGVHKFVLGYNGAGFVMLGVSLGLLVLGLLTCGITLPLLGGVHIIGIIEGIIYLTKSDEEFVRTYVDGHKEWF